MRLRDGWGPVWCAGDQSCVCRPSQGATWQQAVQWVPERRVCPGNELSVTCKHDTYGVSFAACDGEPSGLTAEEPDSADVAVDLAAGTSVDGPVTVGDTSAGSQRATSASGVPASDGIRASAAASDDRMSAAHRARTAADALSADSGVPFKVGQAR